MSLGDSVIRPARSSGGRAEAAPTAPAKPRVHLILGCKPTSAGGVAGSVM